MIISSLEGGLGNQMFQYACAKAVSLKYNQQLKLLYSHSSGQSFHNGFELKRVFNISSEMANKNDLIEVVGRFYVYKNFRKIIKKFKLPFFQKNEYLFEKKFKYDSEIFSSVYGNLLIEGYWQSEKYFNDFREAVLNDFKFDENKLSNKNVDLVKKINKVESVSIHVRRGDYLTNTKAKATHGVCSEKYYFDAIDKVLEKIPNAVFFAFSDEPKWVEQILKKKYKNIIVVDNNFAENSHYDMYLMTKCKHNIIANSSFSWWGAWLNLNSNKIIICPKKWFVDDYIDVNDLLPDNWLKV